MKAFSNERFKRFCGTFEEAQPQVAVAMLPGPIDGQVRLVSLVRLQTNSFYLFIRQQTDK